MQKEARNGNISDGPQRNPRAQGGAGSPGGADMEQKETVRYVNKEEYPDHDVHQSN